MTRELYTAQQFINAIPGTGGVISVIAQRVGCQWHTARKYILEYQTIQIAYNDEREKINDLAVSVLVKSMQADDVATAKWWLERMRKEEFSPRQENVNVDITQLSDDQLKLLQEGKSITDVLKRSAT